MLKATSGSELHDEKANPEPQTQTRTKQKTKSWRQTNDKDLLTWAEQAKSPAKPLKTARGYCEFEAGVLP